MRQGPNDRGDRSSQDSRPELPTLRGGRPDPPSQPPRPPETTLPGIRHRASHRGGLQRGYRGKTTLVGLGVTRFEFGIVGVSQVRRAPRTRPTLRPPRGLVTQLRVSRRSHPPPLPRDRMSRLLVVVPTRHESRLKAKNIFYCNKGVVIKVKNKLHMSFLLDRSHRGHLGKQVLQQSLHCLLVHARAVFPEILLALLTPGTLSRLGLHDLSIFPIVGGFSGSLLLAIGSSPRASLFPQPLLVLLSPPSLPRPHSFFVLHPLLSFSPIHLVPILEVPRPLLESHSLLIVLVPPLPPLSLAPLLHRQNKQRHGVCLSFSSPPVFWGPSTQGPSRVRIPSLPKEAFPKEAINVRAALLISLSSRRRAKMVCLCAAYRTLARSLILARFFCRWRRSLSSTRSWYAASVFILAFRLSCDRRLCSRNLPVFFAFHTLSVSLRRCRLFSFQNTNNIRQLFFFSRITQQKQIPFHFYQLLLIRRIIAWREVKMASSGIPVRSCLKNNRALSASNFKITSLTSFKMASPLRVMGMMSATTNETR